MREYIIRRLLLNIPVLLLVLIAVFSIMRIVPGDVVEQMLEEAGGSAQDQQEQYDRLKAELGLDKPIHIQFAQYLGGLVRGQWGRSLWSDRPVLEEIVMRLPVTIELGVLAIIMSAVMAIPLGVVAAIYQDSLWDYITRVISVSALSIPSFWTATMVLIFPAIWWHYAPPVAYQAPWEDLSENLRHVLVPAFLLGAILMGTVSRMTRSTLLEVIRQDYIRTARAKGLRERVVIARHAMKNAMIPVLTVMGLQFSIVIGGTVIIETIFTLPGVGRLMVESIIRNDYPQLQGNVLFIAGWILAVNLAVDLTYSWLDPRIRYR